MIINEDEVQMQFHSIDWKFNIKPLIVMFLLINLTIGIITSPYLTRFKGIDSITNTKIVEPLSIEPSILVDSKSEQVKLQLTETDGDLIAKLDGNNKPIILNFNELVTQINKVNNLDLVSLNIYDAPGTVIENQIFDGTNISIYNSPNSIVRNNIIKSCDICGIYVVNCSNSTFIKNSISNISTNNYELSKVYGFYVESSSNSIFTDNTLNNLFANTHYISHSECTSIVYGLYVMNSTNLTISANTISDLYAVSKCDIYDSYPMACRATIYGTYMDKSSNLIFEDNIIKNLNATSHAVRGEKGAYATISGLFAYNCENSVYSSNTFELFYAYGNSPSETRVSTKGYDLDYDRDISSSSNSSFNIIRELYSVVESGGCCGSKSWVYGIHSSHIDSIINYNNVSILKAKCKASCWYSGRNGGASAYAYGIFSDSVTYSNMSSNHISTITAEAYQMMPKQIQEESKSISEAISSGIYIKDCTDSILSFNSISTIVANASDYETITNAYGIYLESSENCLREDNTINDLITIKNGKIIRDGDNNPVCWIFTFFPLSLIVLLQLKRQKKE